MSTYWPDKKAASVEPFFMVWCDEDGTNSGAVADAGELQGATISTVVWTVPTGITKDSDNKLSVTIAGIVYAVNTVATIWLSGGTAGTEYELVCTITTSDSRTLVKSVTLRVI